MQKPLPKGWKWVKLGDEHIALLIMGQSPSSATYNATGDGLPFYQGKAEFGEKHPTPNKWCSEPLKIAFPDDILFSVRAPVGYVNICEKKACIGRGLAAIRTMSNSLVCRYLFHYLRSSNEHWSKMVTGSTFEAITGKVLQNFLIPLPPLETQHKIVEILEEADRLRTHRRQADDKMKSLIPALFVDMFGDPATNPKGWAVKKLGEVCTLHSGGTPSKNNNDFWGGNIPFLTGADLTAMKITASQARSFLTETGMMSGKTEICEKGTVMLATRTRVGMVGIAQERVCVSQDVSPIICQKLINSGYMAQLLLMRQNYFISNSRGATIKGITKEFLEKMPVSIPPLPLQQQFASIVTDIEAEKSRQSASRSKLDDLFNSLLHRAFSGELIN